MQHLITLCHEYKKDACTPLTRLLLASCTPHTRLLLCHEYKERRVHTSYTPLTRLLHASYTPHTLSRIQRKTSTHAHMHDMSIHAHTSATTTAHQSPTPCITPLNKRRQRIHRQRPATCPLTRLLHASYTPLTRLTCHLPLKRRPRAQV